MGVGFSVQIAQRAGANDIEGARNVVRTAVFTCISVGIVAGILLQMIAPFIPVWMGGAPEVIPLAQDYVRIYLMGVPFSILAMVFLTYDAKSGRYEDANDPEHNGQYHQLRPEFPLYL